MVHGLLLIDKSPGMTSHDVVSRVRKILNTSSVGHCGTLDPLASGLMVLLIGEATKLSNYILDRDKAYEVSLRLGLETDTFDIEGTVLKEKDVQVSESAVQKKGLEFHGDFEWPVPMYSAVKMQGEKLYEMARRGQTVQTPVKTMSFRDVQFLGGQGRDFRFSLACTKGSYIRSWVHNLGLDLGVGAIMIGLRRLKSEPYSVDGALSLESLEAKKTELASHPAFIPISLALPEMKRVRVAGFDQNLLKNGQISLDLRSQLIPMIQPEVDETFKVLSRFDGRLVALIGYEKGRGIFIKRVFQY